jgi:hypothetical protein
MLFIFATYIIKAMAISSKVGRPVCIAAIDFSYDLDQELYDRFYKACRTLNCCDIPKLAKALKISERGVWYWKEGKRFPETRGTAGWVIRWVEEGKPIEFRTQAQIAASVY